MDFVRSYFFANEPLSSWTLFSSKLDSYKCLVLKQVQNDFELSKLFWSGPNHFGWVQIILDRSKLWKSSTEKSNLNPTYLNDLDPTKTIWTRPKHFVPDQSNLYSPKSFWTHRRTRHKYAVYMTLWSTGLLKESWYKLYKTVDF